MLRYFPLDITCSSKLTVFLEPRSRKTFRILEQIMSADIYQSIFSRQVEAIVYVYVGCQDLSEISQSAPHNHTCSRCKMQFVDNSLNNKKIILLNLAEHRLILANSACGLVG